MKRPDEDKDRHRAPGDAGYEQRRAYRLFLESCQPQPAAAQSDSQAPSSLAACQSSDDLARYLHTLGWRGILDQEWTNLPLLWEEIKELRS